MKGLPSRIPGPGWSIPALAGILLVGVAGWFPLFNEPGYELSLLVGLVLPSVTAVAVAVELRRSTEPPREMLEAGLLRGLAGASTALAVGMAHAARSGACDLWTGTFQFALGAGAGTLLAGGWGALAATLTRAPAWRRWGTLGLALAGPWFGIVAALLRFYGTPAVYFYDHFFGYFAGPLYDTVFDDGPLLSFRVGSAAWLLTAWLVAQGLEGDSRAPPGWRPPRWALAFAQVATLSVALWIGWNGTQLGHSTTAASLRRELDRSARVAGCEVVYPGAIPRREAELLARQCAAHLASLGRYFDLPTTGPVTVFLFTSWRQKQRLVGAGTTYIAKPWRREVFLQSAGFPHPVLRHELAHVVVGDFGRGPLLVSGPLGGVIPDPGRIEGMAVASSPGAGSGLTLDEQARVQLELGKLPALERVFSLSFLGTSSVSAYSVAGAFIDWLGRTRGKAVLRAWYSGEPLEVCAGASLSSLENEWRAFLATVPLTPQALEAGRVRYAQASIFGRRCPRQVDRLLDAAEGSIASDPEGAELLLDRVAALDPDGYRSKVDRIRCDLSRRSVGSASTALQRLAADQRRHPLERLEAEEMLGDLDWLVGRTELAQERYVRVAQLAVRGSRLRTLELKLGAWPEVARRALGPLLFAGSESVPALELGARLARWADADPTSRYPHYLLGRQLLSLGRLVEARVALRTSLDPDRSPWSDRFQREAARQWLLAECAEPPGASAVDLLPAIEIWQGASGAAGAAERAAMDRLVELCRGMHPERP